MWKVNTRGALLQSSICTTTTISYTTGGSLMMKNLNQSDFDEYYRVRLQSLEQYPVAYSSMPKFFIESSKEMHLSLLKDSGSESDFYLKGFFLRQRLVGLIGMKPETRECVNHKASMWGFYVDPEFQGQGIGEQLLDQFITDAIHSKIIRSIRLVVPENSKKAISLFKKKKFEIYGLEKNGIRDLEGKFHHQIYVQLMTELGEKSGS